MASSLKIVAVLSLALATAGCQQSLLYKPITVDTAGVSPKVDYGELSAVLAKAVNGDGFLDMHEANRVATRLDSQLKLLAVTGPTVTPGLFPTRQDKLAYWYNARAAWSVKLALLNGCVKDPPLEAIERRPVPLDGRRITLEEIDRILTDDGWRTVVAAPSVRLYRARLPKDAFSAGDIDSAIERRFDEFMGDGKRFVIDVDSRQVRFPPVLWQFRQQLIDDYNGRYHTQGANLTTALLPQARGMLLRRLQDAIGYACVEGPAAGPLATVKGDC